MTVANGTDAIELGLRALGIGKGHIVATVANAGMYTTTALMAIGAKPFFLDVDLDTCNTTLEEVRRALNSGVDAVVVTHLYGLAVSEIEMISKLCRQKNIPLLEDCSQAHGASIAGKRVSSFGDIGVFSFYPTKNLGSLGDGGAVVTNDASIAETVVRLRQYGWSKKYQVELTGGRNSRLDELQAAILSALLPKLDFENELRRRIANRYNQEIRSPKLKLPHHAENEYVAHLFVVRCVNRESLRSHLADQEIASAIHYPIPDHKQHVFLDRYAHIVLPNTEQLASEILTLPCYPDMNDAAVNRVIYAINDWAEKTATKE